MVTAPPCAQQHRDNLTVQCNFHIDALASGYIVYISIG